MYVKLLNTYKISMTIKLMWKTVHSLLIVTFRVAMCWMTTGVNAAIKSDKLIKPANGNSIFLWRQAKLFYGGYYFAASRHLEGQTKG